MNKRGISPLIATFVLLLIAVGLGVIILTVGKAQIESAAQCPVKIDMSLEVLNGKEQLCLDKSNNKIYFLLENGAAVDIKMIRLTAVGEKATYILDLPDSYVKKAAPLMKNIPYDYSSYGEIKKLKLIPIINLYQEDMVCAGQAIVREKIRDC